MKRAKRAVRRTAPAPRVPGRRSQVESAKTRERILDRAEKLFANRGFGRASLREVATAAGVRQFTVQHHFGSKARLYEAVLSRRHEEIAQCIGTALGQGAAEGVGIDHVVDALFDLMLERRSWVALTTRVALGENLPGGVRLGEFTWLPFIEEGSQVPPAGWDPRMLLISFEALLHAHVLAANHYRNMFGKDVTDPGLKRQTKAHLKRLLRCILETQSMDEPVVRGLRAVNAPRSSGTP